MQKFSKNPEFIQELFNSISTNYDKLNSLMSLGMHKRIKKDAVNKVELQDGAKILDLCTGTGDLAGMLRDKYPKSPIVAVDFSKNMLEIAQKKYPDIDFVNADCTQLPFEGEQFDLCVISFGLRNTENINKTLKEIYRVLKPGGYFINVDLGKPKGLVKYFLKIYMYIWVAILGKVFHGKSEPYKYLAVSNESFPSQNILLKLYREIGFQEAKNKDYVFGQIASQVCRK